MPRVRRGEAGLALAAVTQAAEENRGRTEKYVRTWWVEAVTQHLVTPSERQKEKKSAFLCVLVSNLLWTRVLSYPESVWMCVCSCCRTLRRHIKEERRGLFPVLLPGVGVAVDKCTGTVTHDFITTVALDFFQVLQIWIRYLIISMGRKTILLLLLLSCQDRTDEWLTWSQYNHDCAKWT